MESPYFRNMHTIYGKKIGLLFLTTLLFAGQAMGQALNKPFYDYDRFIHFGFTIGTSYATLKYDLNPAVWTTQTQINSISAQGSPGLTIGGVVDLHLGSSKSDMREHFDLRLIPSLVLTERQFVFNMKDTGSAPIIKKQIESAIVEFPLLLKFKSDRYQNLRFYAIGGGKFSYDLSSTAKAAKNPANPKISIYPAGYSYEYGAGLDLYFPFFKFSPEIKVSQGINNLLVPDTTVYSAIFSRFRSNFIYFSLYFEG
jgi:hypothetical protein